MPAPPPSRTHWGDPKRQRSISITDAGWAALGAYAEAARMTRSEACERLFRSASPAQPALETKEWTVVVRPPTTDA